MMDFYFIILKNVYTTIKHHWKVSFPLGEATITNLKLNCLLKEKYVVTIQQIGNHYQMQNNDLKQT